MGPPNSLTAATSWGRSSAARSRVEANTKVAATPQDQFLGAESVS